MTGGIGGYFIGICDQDLSAGQSPVSVWVEGVFELTGSSGWTTAYVGEAVMPDSGKVVNIGAILSGNAPMGSYIPAGTGERSGRTVLVNISPVVWRWSTYNVTTTLGDSGVQGDVYPRNL
jgi:hypothetical protein